LSKDFLNNVLLLDIIRLLKKLIKFDVLSLYETKVFCPQGHICNLTSKAIKNHEDGSFECKKCKKNGLF